MRIWLPVLAFLGGCSGRSEVVITGIAQHFTPSGTHRAPADLSMYRIQIYAGGNRYPAAPVVGDASGRLVIPGVPEGAFVIEAQLRDGRRVWWSSSEHDVTWTFKYAGRVDARPAEVAQPMTLAIDGLAAWSADDRLSVASREIATEMSPELEPALAVNSTAVAATFDWNAPDAWSWGRADGAYLLDEGDTITVARHHRVLEADARQVSTLTQVLELAAPHQAEGEPLTLTGTMATIELAAQVRLSVDHAAFGSAIGGELQNVGWEMAVYRTPPWTSTFAIGPSLLAVAGRQPFEPAPTTHVYSYGDPFDAGWDRYVYGRYEHTVSSQNQTLIHAYSNSMTRLDGNQYALTPPAVFATEARLEGISIAGQTLAWDGESPLALEIPAAVDGFRAVIQQVIQEDRYERYEYAGSLRADGRHMLLPSSVFARGNTYRLLVTIGDSTETSYGYTTTALGPLRFEAP